jgi:hypothetical protein
MAGSWTGMADDINKFFKDPNVRKKVGTDFRTKHGNDGAGYSFGRFLENFNRPDNNNPMLTGNSKGQFLIDSGTNHWDPASLKNVEDAVRRNLTRPKAGGKTGEFDEKKIVFKIDTVPTAIKATSTVTEKSDSDGEYTEIHIFCPPLGRTTP